MLVVTLSVYFNLGPTPVVITWSIMLVLLAWFLVAEYRRTHWPIRLRDFIPMTAAEFISAMAEGPRKRRAS